jgi:hypothetical protein
MLPIIRVRCDYCGAPLPPVNRKGPPRRYCPNNSCRFKARRRREGLTSWRSIAHELPDPPPDDPITRRQRTLEALAAVMEGEPPAPLEDQFGASLLEARALVWAWRRFARELHGPLAARAADLAADLDRSLKQRLPEVDL